MGNVCEGAVKIHDHNKGASKVSFYRKGFIRGRVGFSRGMIFCKAFMEDKF